MKNLSKLSIIIVCGAALASSGFAQQHHDQQSRPAPARQSAPRPAATQFRPSQAVRSAPPARTAPQYVARSQTPPSGITEYRRTSGTPTQLPWGNITTQTNQRVNVVQNQTHHDSQTVRQNVNTGRNNGGRNGNRNQNTGWQNTGRSGQGGNSVWGPSNTRTSSHDRQDTGDRGAWSNVRDFRSDRNGDFRVDYDRRSDGGGFHFNLYLSAPTQACVVSPWYDYSVLPAYLPASVVIQNGNAICAWDQGSTYGYQYGGNSALNLAVSDITSMFQNDSTSALDALIPSSGQVAIFNDNSYMYSLNDGDFRQMMEDNFQNTETESFQVTSVLADGAQATVNCTHTFSDPNGGTETVYQQYRLQLENGRYAIVDFSTHQ